MTQQGTQEGVNQQIINILLVDDNEADVTITKRTLKQHMLPHEINVVEDGLEALNYLYRKSPYEDSKRYPMPDLMIVDLQMPHLDGHELIEKIKSEKEFHSIHIMVLSASRKDEDVKKSFEQGAVIYIHKSMEDVELVGIIKMFNEYWQIRNEGWPRDPSV